MNSLSPFTVMIDKRFGASTSLPQFLQRANVLQMEGAQSLFAAFRVHEPQATGVVHRMLNSAWPSFYWQLYDRYGVPTSAFYGVKRANRPVIMGKFEQNDDLQAFVRREIVVIAQDHKRIFSTVPNVTSDYRATGSMAADYFLDCGFRSFAYCGYDGAVWSEERCRGFRQRIKERGKAIPFGLFTDKLTDEP